MYMMFMIIKIKCRSWHNSSFFMLDAWFPLHDNRRWDRWPRVVLVGTVPRSTPLVIMTTNWSFTDEIDVCNSDLIMITTKVIAGNKILTKDHLNLLVPLFGLNLSIIDRSKIIVIKREMCLPPANSQKRKNERDPRQRQLRRRGARSHTPRRRLVTWKRALRDFSSLIIRDFIKSMWSKQ